MTLQEIEKILSTLARKLERQQYAVKQTQAEQDAWKDLRSAKEKEPKK